MTAESPTSSPSPATSRHTQPHQGEQQLSQGHQGG